MPSWNSKIIMPRWLERYQPVLSEEEDEKFLSSDDNSSGSGSLSPIQEYTVWKREQQPSCWAQYRAKACLLHVCFLAINLSVSAIVVMYGIGAPPFALPALIHSPVLEALEYTKHVYNHSASQSYYVQPPSPEMDERWQNLILGNFIRLSPEDLKKVNRLDDDTVRLDDGSGVGLVNAHHEIHCIMGLYQALHPEYYWPNATDVEQQILRHHTDHCLDYLLQASMCHGDPGFMTLHWDMRTPIPRWRSAEHTCVNWDNMRNWLQKRKVAIHEPGFLVHPKFGPAYPDGVTKIPTILD